MRRKLVVKPEFSKRLLTVFVDELRNIQISTAELS